MDKILQPCLVIGARGMLGTDLTRALRESGLSTLGLDLEEVDIRQFDSVMETLKRWDPGTVFNCAAFTDVDGCESRQEEAFAVNARGPEHLARACLKTRSVLVHISSDYVFDGMKGSPYREEDPMNPLGVYGKSKAEGERLVREALPQRHCIVRTQWLYGRHGRNFVEAILKQARERSSLTVVNDQYGSPTYSADLSRALIDVCARGGRGTFHITNSGVTTWHGFACKIVEFAGHQGVKVERIDSATLNRPAQRPGYSALDNSRFAHHVGARLRGWEDALRGYLGERSKNTFTRSPTPVVG